MKNFPLLIICLFSTFGFSQRIMRTITDNSQSTIVDVYRFRNGTAGTVVGPKGFNTELSDAGGFSFYAPRAALQYNSQYSDLICDLMIANQFFCDGVFENKSITGFLGHSYYATDNNYVQHYFDISPKVIDMRCDEIHDGNSNIDLLRLQFHLPKTMTDGSSVPTETWALLEIGNAVDLDLNIGNNGVTSYIFAGNKIFLKFDGERWIEQSRDWNNNPVELLESECGEKVAEEIVIESSQLIIYPIPASDFVYIKSSSNQSTLYDFNFFDMLGRKVLSGQVLLGQGINIQKFSTGNYIFQLSVKDVIMETQKIIKK